MTSFGDSHNFGIKVQIFKELGLVYKPRSVFWEEWILSEKSSLRNWSRNNTHKSIYKSPFVSMSKIEFYNESLSTNEALVKLIAPIEKVSTDNIDFKQIGQLLGIATWLGIDDLHIENIIPVG